MIKQTFYNLPREKRERISQAIKLEFARCPAERISINRIVQTANISRGSFYQYFDDKVDLVQIVTEEVAGFAGECIEKSLINSKGNLFKVPIDLFDDIIAFSEHENHKNLVERVVGNFKANSDLISDYLKNRHIIPEKPQITTYINTEMLASSDEDSMRVLFELLITTMFKALFDIFMCGRDIQTVREELLKKIDMIECGSLSREAMEERMGCLV